MKKSKQPPPKASGWLAAKAEMDKRNNEARQRAEKQGEAHAERAAAERRRLARLEMSDLPSQPGGDDSR